MRGDQKRGVESMDVAAYHPRGITVVTRHAIERERARRRDLERKRERKEREFKRE